MDLRQYLVVLKRRKWVILQAIVIVAAVAAGLSTLQEPSYRATARVLLHPNDPAEHLYSENASPRVLTDPDRYISGQIDVIESESVRREAAGLLGLDRRPAALAEAVSVRQDGNSDVLEISATDRSPHRAANVANAVARAYIENRRLRTVQGLDRAVDEAQQKLADLERRMADLDAQLASFGPSGQLAAPPGAGGVSDRSTTRESLMAARQATSDQYQSLYARQQELVVNKSLKQGEAEIVSDAKAPASPASPTPWRNGTLGAIGGLFLGLAAAFLKEQLDERLRSREEVERANGLPVLAEIPLDSETSGTGGRVAAIEHPLGSVAEAVRSLRSSLLFLGLDRSAKRLVVTSPGPAEGKSYVAANLAAAYAQAGFSTILVSSDLRRPRLESLLGTPSTPGLSDVICELSSSRWKPELLAESAGTARNGSTPLSSPVVERARAVWLRQTVESALAETNLPGLRLLPAGVATQNPAELLGSLAAGAVFDALAELADVVVVDSPPVLAVTDATILAAKADGVIIVNALGQTQREAAKRTRQTLETAGAPLLGVVVNKVRVSSDSYFYYSRYYGADLADDGAVRRRSRRGDGSGERHRRRAAKADAG